jgi:hypothetical protein
MNSLEIKKQIIEIKKALRGLSTMVDKLEREISAGGQRK